MARNIIVTPADLETAAQKIEGLAAEYETQYNNLYSETDSLASSWKGEDNQAFVSQIAEFKPDLQNMKKLMDNYADFLRKAAKTYRETQEAVTSQARTLAN
ncbi:MAG: WXG100 family type VII secretion target [Clostridia bacterium]|nr:WXG100 family type VII secretion target [Clostridia bacterium]